MMILVIYKYIYYIGFFVFVGVLGAQQGGQTDFIQTPRYIVVFMVNFYRFIQLFVKPKLYVLFLLSVKPLEPLILLGFRDFFNYSLIFSIVQFDEESISFGNSAAVKAVFCLLLSLVYGLAHPYWRLSTAITPTGFLLPVTSLFDKLSSRN